MTFRKSVSLVLIASQVSLGTMIASADTISPASTTSPEFTLVESVLTLQGENLSTTDLQTQVNAAVTTYVATAQTEGSQQRLQQALVDLGVYTTAQAQSFVTDAQSASSNVLSAEPVMPSQTEAMVSQEMSQLASLHPAGAQFSSCTTENVGGGAAIAGLVTVLVGLYLRFDNPTCTTPASYATVCGANGCDAVTVYGETTCTTANYYPHAAAGNDVMIAGGVVLGLGALVAYLGSKGC